jgi:hypothetical protein
MFISDLQPVTINMPISLFYCTFNKFRLQLKFCMIVDDSMHQPSIFVLKFSYIIYSVFLQREHATGWEH